MFTGIKKVGDSAHTCWSKKALELIYDVTKTPNHMKFDNLDYKAYCDQANSLLTWKNTLIFASAAVLMQSSLI